MRGKKNLMKVVCSVCGKEFGDTKKSNLVSGFNNGNKFVCLKCFLESISIPKKVGVINE